MDFAESVKFRQETVKYDLRVVSSQARVQSAHPIWDSICASFVFLPFEVKYAICDWIDFFGDRMITATILNGYVQTSAQNSAKNHRSLRGSVLILTFPARIPVFTPYLALTFAQKYAK
jgi:hypothetical protein